MNSIDTIRSFFNQLAPQWEDDTLSAPVRDEITARAAFPHRCTIADIGCGKGIMVPHLMDTNPGQIIEIDVSEVMMQLNRDQWGEDPRISFVCGDILTAGLPMVDAAIIFNAYPHFLDKKALAKELARILPGNGMLVIAHSKGKESINHIHHDSSSCERISIPLKTPLEEYGPFRDYFSLEDWEDSERLYFMKLTRKPNQ